MTKGPSNRAVPAGRSGPAQRAPANRAKPAEGNSPLEQAAAAAARNATNASKLAEIESRLYAQFEPVVQAAGLELVAIKLATIGLGGRLQILIDRKEGQGSIKLDDCAKVSRKLSALLDTDDPIEQAYDLEVSSPGINRVLRHEADFRRFIGLSAKVTVGAAQDGDANAAQLAGRETVQGVIEAAENGTVTIKLGKKATRVIALADVHKASLNPSLKEWEVLGKKLALENAALAGTEEGQPDEADDAEDEEIQWDDAEPEEPDERAT